MHRMLSALVVAALGCGGGTSGPDAPPDAPECRALGTCDWLDDYQRTIVGAARGRADIAPGVRLLHRASVAERDATRRT